MSFVFITDTRAYKLKKPVLYPFLDFTTLDAREHFCREELRLNRRLADQIYLDCIALRFSPKGGLALSGQGEIVDWLVEMQRLPDADMLDTRLSLGKVKHYEIRRLAEKLSRFYESGQSSESAGLAYDRHLKEEAAVNAEHLIHARDYLERDDIGTLLNRFERLQKSCRDEFENRLQSNLIVEGHGDLRPEHVCLLPAPIVFDCLEFDPNMRFIDPYDEMNSLALECSRLGAFWIRDLLLKALGRTLAHPASERLLACYGAFRMLLRARLSIDHLLDAHPRHPETWPVQANGYLDLAQRILAAAR